MRGLGVPMIKDMDYRSRVVVVTGGANGIGRCIAEKFLEAGARLIINDIDFETLSDMERRYGSERLVCVSGDIGDEKTLRSIAETVKNHFGRVDFLINNACVTMGGILSSCSFEDFNACLRVGVTAPYMLTKWMLELFTSEGAVVNIASTRAAMSQPDTESYTAAKGALVALTHGLSVSLAGRVRVNAISPGWIDTAGFYTNKTTDTLTSEADRLQHTVGRIGKPEDVAAMVLYLCSPQAHFINGQNFIIDGGMSKLMIYNGDYGWSFTPEP